ncbi:putative AAA family ATPase YTA6 [Kluyveromyces lactis]|uniref:KLLA0E23409p n=1 Tax=Kluyveromyces lactis (strain ATCC 8585 / CBS 2359 / DSM 70799 / NBRC 1267 / NRRL Y-1140 / WM37) TaxID=284590 RepID=Q6CM31_KLULA|nr:uncharacterized protein KLLA0_E23409g [Kluyveromyces lactis]CAH00095.1 KLLA0E23409p [Kluyveromyces lactis]|eukprot:XP_455008.1 uncharacterized protein KLLA0_E23409g [Kluyveromyces lactis]
MPHDHFIVPNNVSLTQALSLLHSIVSIQLDNCKEQKAKGSKEETVDILCSILSYLREGLISIKKKFNVVHYGDLKDPNVVTKYADVRILGQEIKDMCAELESKSQDKRDPDWRSKLKMKFIKSNVKQDQERALKEKEQVEKLKQERDRIQREEKDKEARLLKKKEQEIEKQVRKDVQEELRKTKLKSTDTAERNVHETMMPPTRRSMDQLTRKAETFGRRSLDGFGRRKSYQNEVRTVSASSPNVNQAALLAWSGQSSQKVAQSKPKAKQTFVYTKPTVRRPVIKSPVRTSPRIPVEVAFETPIIDRERIRSPVSRSVPHSRSTSVDRKGGQDLSLEKSEKALTPLEKKLAHIMDNLEGVDENSCLHIINDILIADEKVYWDDISGLNTTKSALKETVVYPFLRPDLFQGLREPVSGILLFGPPGTGKTMIAKAVATESKSTFFSISASSVLSKFLGESEKLVRALFYLSKKLAPSIIFVDEIDSLLTTRSDNENESSRRIKTEFLIRWSSLTSATASEKSEEQMDSSRVLVLAATNTPWDLDEAARRRFSKRIYIPLPDYETRHYHLKRLMAVQRNQLTESDFNEIARLTEGYSGSDLTSLAKDAAMEPIRDLGETLINANLELVRGVTLQDFESAMTRVKRSVSTQSLLRFEQWALTYGST